MESREDIKPNVAAVATWHDRWHGMLLRVLSKRLAGRADIQDLAQEVYLRMLRVEKPDLI